MIEIQVNQMINKDLFYNFEYYLIEEKQQVSCDECPTSSSLSCIRCFSTRTDLGYSSGKFIYFKGGNKNHLKIIYKYFYYSFAKLHLQNYLECSVHVTPLDSVLLCINKVNFILHGCLEKGKGDNKILYSYMRIFMFSY